MVLFEVHEGFKGHFFNELRVSVNAKTRFLNGTRVFFKRCSTREKYICCLSSKFFSHLFEALMVRFWKQENLRLEGSNGFYIKKVIY